MSDWILTGEKTFSRRDALRRHYSVTPGHPEDERITKRNKRKPVGLEVIESSDETGETGTYSPPPPRPAPSPSHWHRRQDSIDHYIQALNSEEEEDRLLQQHYRAFSRHFNVYDLGSRLASINSRQQHIGVDFDPFSIAGHQQEEVVEKSYGVHQTEEDLRQLEEYHRCQQLLQVERQASEEQRNQQLQTAQYGNHITDFSRLQLDYGSESSPMQDLQVHDYPEEGGHGMVEQDNSYFPTFENTDQLLQRDSDHFEF
jgi:hypothetical protein